jgi:outer membrane protein OmpA-like peptidoglycan-associated protein
MNKSRWFTSSFAAISLVAVSACVTDPNTGEKKVSRTAVGSVGGALAGMLLGGVIGGKTGRIVGAGLGGVAGGIIGYKMDKQIKAILVNLPDGVTFDVGSSALKPQFRDTLSRIAASMNQYPSSLIDVYGHTDSTGSSSFNQVLSESRARTVANYLASQGVSAARIRSQGFGETMPIADNNTLDGRAKNRRVEIKIVPVTQDDVQAARSGQ